MLNFLVNSTHPELPFGVYQCARFYGAPKLLYKQVVTRIVQYILSTRKKRLDRNLNIFTALFFAVIKTKITEVYVDALFNGSFDEN